jgi:hypothetical protein
MEIDYVSSKLKKLATSHSKLMRKFWNKRVVDAILIKLRELGISDHLKEFMDNQITNIRLHKYDWDREWEVSIDVLNKFCPYRILFRCKDEDITQDMYNQEKRKNVTIIEITQIWDPHKQ